MFCKNCGNKLCDEAYVCPNCGCLANESVTAQNEKETENKKEMALKTLLVFAFGLICVAFLFIILAIAQPEISVYAYRGDYDVNIYLNWDYRVLSLIMAIFGFIAGVAAFILGLKWVKAFKVMSIFCFMSSLIMLITTVSLMMI